MDRDIGKPSAALAGKAGPERASAQSLLPTTFELQRLAAIIEGSEDAIIGQTLGGQITSWNGGATRMFGYTAEEMVGRPLAQIVPRDLLEEELETLARLARGERVDRFHTITVRKDGCRIAVAVTLSPLQDSTGKAVGAVKIVRDLSDRTRSNEALHDANEVAQQARLEAEGAKLVKTEFLAVMSHEIRTPLNTITGFVDLLKNSAGLTPQQRRYAELVQSANALLLTIVNDILDFSKIEAGQLELELRPFSLTNLIDDMMATVLPSATTKSLLLKCVVGRGVPDWVMGDNVRLRQVLLNLLNNAIKFTDKGSITVDVGPQTAPAGRDRILFSIADTGIGIASEVQRELDRNLRRVKVVPHGFERGHPSGEPCR